MYCAVTVIAPGELNDVVSCVVQNAVRAVVPFNPVVFCTPLVGLHMTGEPRAVPPFAKITLPVGPAPLLVVVTIALRVTGSSGVTELRLAFMLAVVAALVMVTESVLLVLG